MWQFFVEHNIALLRQPSYSPVIPLCDFWLFPKLKNPLKKHRFGDKKTVEDNSMSTQGYSKNWFLGLLQKVETPLKSCYSMKWGLLWRMPLDRWRKIMPTWRLKEYVIWRKLFGQTSVSKSESIDALKNNITETIAHIQLDMRYPELKKIGPLGSMSSWEFVADISIIITYMGLSDIKVPHIQLVLFHVKINQLLLKNRGLPWGRFFRLAM